MLEKICGFMKQQWPPCEELIRECASHSFAVVPFSLSRAQLEDAALSFLEFLALPQEEKEELFFRVDPANRGTSVGYRSQDRARGDTDTKEYFHYNRYAEDRFGGTSQPVVVRAFMEQAREVYAHAERCLEQILHLLEEQFPGLVARFFPPEQHPNFYLRFAKYPPLGRDTTLAQGHYDRGGCTLAIAQSSPGLRIGKNPESLREVWWEEYQALFFPGPVFPEITHPNIVPSWHDAVQVYSAPYRAPDIQRWVIMFFADTAQMRNLSYKEAHTPKY